MRNNLTDTKTTKKKKAPTVTSISLIEVARTTKNRSILATLAENDAPLVLAAVAVNPYINNTIMATLINNPNIITETAVQTLSNNASAHTDLRHDIATVAALPSTSSASSASSTSRQKAFLIDLFNSFENNPRDVFLSHALSISTPILAGPDITILRAVAANVHSTCLTLAKLYTLTKVQTDADTLVNIANHPNASEADLAAVLGFGNALTNAQDRNNVLTAVARNA